MSRLVGRRILLGITAGIAAYKSAVLARLLKKAGAEVRVVMTEGAQAFITPLTLQALTGEPVRTSLLDPAAEAGMGHIELARWAEDILIAPATADIMARLAHGHADDLLTTLCLATKAHCYYAPAMNQAMWRHPATQANSQRLATLGWRALGPDSGDQACGDIGSGRMLEPEAIVTELTLAIDQTRPGPGEIPLDAPPAHDDREPPADPRAPLNASATPLLHGLHIAITAGPTREAIDPVRYLSNHSSGRMGFALAEAAVALGARVTLISGPVTLETPAGVERIDVVSALEMLAAAEQTAPHCDWFIGCAAVADYRLAQISEHKLKKQSDHGAMTLHLIENPDIIAAVAARPTPPWTIGFAAETRELAQYAGDKLRRKGLDMIAANDVTAPGLGFGAEENALTLYHHGEGAELVSHVLPTCHKRALAEALLRYAHDRYRAHQPR
ncbi:bifunctional phosphopantothenoylcysteine decarboxylase/phosphopantothenate synthase [Kushneria phosphatilytica]|uniref:Coenzyme A biosynthesis bifunctional protein CoaBC n=1 Tax=Kushneria phosphatilytica TaxID=657387 RepID=A0A1S1NQL4_9GAMM|nr:bifunctional phosphopantothenoylcysteine decarboxylase/phosphopantothenate synthase [Kushneria phosphatilytica]OHV10909.1 bifunctional 4'-phosphopantothenoylcysteine decarboxylase/phosphopantothenoylcysteine synthetase [Kushneria phosphatilytica]QEL12005.1 bifunctional phosphopantothenoylcysteine decarboxylase/phosphopantothenate synthase [Kushneria phosphatilytica]